MKTTITILFMLAVILAMAIVIEKTVIDPFISEQQLEK